MSIETAINALITGDENVSAIIGTRLYPVYLPQGVLLPAIVYEQIDETDDLTLEGAAGLPDGRFKFTVYAAMHASCLDLTAALKLLLSDYSGVSADVTIEHVRILNKGDLPALNAEAEQLNRFAKFLDVQFSFIET